MNPQTFGATPEEAPMEGSLQAGWKDRERMVTSQNKLTMRNYISHGNLLRPVSDLTLAAGIPESSFRQDLCPVTETIKIIGKKWYLIILHELTKGPRGFNELRRNVRGISAKVLSESLQHLERRQLVARRVHSDSPIRVEYSLTQKGAELESLFDDMKAWGDKWQVCNDADASPNARLVAPTAAGPTSPPRTL
jgi:DNA-binding HxlR family transcriptional regulator